MNRYFTLLTLCLLSVLYNNPAIAQEYSFKPHSNSRSDRQLLNLPNTTARQYSENLTKSAVPGRASTLRILAIRVEFQVDNSPLTTGDGTFELEVDNTKLIDVPPHDRSYFEAQLTALSNYFEQVSGANLLLDFDVFPREQNSSYTVSQPLTHYVPPGDEQLLDTRLAEFFEEAFQLADAAGDINFANYDIFLIFHAGVGGDFAFDFDPTPQDMPSVFLSTETLRNEIGNGDENYQGVAVNNGSFFIKDGIILPESQSQDDFDIGLLGTAAIMFGSQLGLPLLFNPDNGRAGVGVFGLMDQGSGNFLGLLPAAPSAWEKVFLGWERPIEVISGENLDIAISQAANPNKIYKLPINGSEYFLIENRNRDLFSDEIAVGRDAAGTRVEFVWNAQVGQALRFDTTSTRQLSVITEVDDYDFGLPGSGILIWHIDEAAISMGLLENRVNANPEMRGIDLEEADGAQDLGRFYGFLSAGAGSENGVLEDMFWGTNEINICVNSPDPVACFASETRSGTVQFTPFSLPNSRSNSGANTNIYLTDFSEPDSIMTFTVSNMLAQDGFPKTLPAESQRPQAPVAYDLDGDGQGEIVVVTGTGEIFAWRADGSTLFDSGKSTGLIGMAGNNALAPAIGEVGGQSMIVVAHGSGVSGFATTDSNSDSLADVAFEYTTNENISTVPMISQQANDFLVIVGTEEGSLIGLSASGDELFSLNIGGSLVGFGLVPDGGIVFSANAEAGIIGKLVNGTVEWQTNVSGEVRMAPVIADLDQDRNYEIAFASSSPELIVFQQNGDIHPDFPRALDFYPASQLAIGNIDESAELEIIYLTSDSRLVVLNNKGFAANNFPTELSDSVFSGAEPVFASPVLANVVEGADVNVVAGTRTSLVAFGSNGLMAPGFPIATGDVSLSAPFVDDLDSDADSELIAVGTDNRIYVFDLSTPYSRETVKWQGLLGGPNHTNRNTEENLPNAPGNELLPPGTVYNYPNPTEGQQTTIRYTLSDNAEVRIKIFDLAGAFVDELVGPGFGRSENEVTWPLSNIESGIYLARVEAKNQENSAVAVIKIAVVK